MTWERPSERVCKLMQEGVRRTGGPTGEGLEALLDESDLIWATAHRRCAPNVQGRRPLRHSFEER